MTCKHTLDQMCIRDSDNAYLALLALLAIFPFYGFKTVKGVRDYCLMVAVLCSEFWLIDWICLLYTSRCV